MGGGWWVVDHVVRIGGVPYHWKQAIKSMSFPAIQFVRHIAQFHIQFYGRTSRSPIYFTTVRRRPVRQPPSPFFLLFFLVFFPSFFCFSFFLFHSFILLFSLSLVRQHLPFFLPSVLYYIILENARIAFVIYLDIASFSIHHRTLLIR